MKNEVMGRVVKLNTWTHQLEDSVAEDVIKTMRDKVCSDSGAVGIVGKKSVEDIDMSLCILGPGVMSE